MGANLNKVFIAGNIVRTPEVKEVGKSTVANFSLATNKKYKNQAGEWVKQTEYIPVVAWGATAQNIGKYTDKGSNVLVEGEFTTRSWDDKDGNKRYKSEIKAMSVTFLDSNKQGEQSQAAQDAQAVFGGEADDDAVPF